MRILAIETSCDETAAAVLEIKNGAFRVLANEVSSSVELAVKYGGVVPEVAARQQMIYVLPIIEMALSGAVSYGRNQKSKEQEIKKLEIKKLKNFVDYIAVVNGPGLITSLRVGVEAGRSLAYAWGKKLVTVNHLEGHFYSAILNNNQDTRYPPESLRFARESLRAGKIQKNSKFQIPNSKFIKLSKLKFPALGLIVSGGHTELVLMKDYLKYEVIGRTLDDAAGEAFDKAAKILGLGYPGGPIISKRAEVGDSSKIGMPRPMLNSHDYNFSFSGIKTAVLYKVRDYLDTKTLKYLNTKAQNSLGDEFINDLCAAFQEACVDVLVKKTMRAAEEYKVRTILLGGGVSANLRLRERVEEEVRAVNAVKTVNTVKTVNSGESNGVVELLIPDLKMTGDNALMIALAAYYKIKKKKWIDWRKVRVDPNLRLG